MAKGKERERRGQERRAEQRKESRGKERNERKGFMCHNRMFTKDAKN